MKKGGIKQASAGITLVALIITVIVMLILAGVGLNFSLGENGIFEKAKQSTQLYSQKEAREKLEMALSQMVLEKQTDATYNQNEYLDKKLKEQGINLTQSTATIGQWQFEVDREHLVIKDDKDDEEVKIEISQTKKENGTVNVTVQITTKKELSQIKVAGEQVEVPTPEHGVYTIQKEIRQNGECRVEIEEKEGQYYTRTIMIEGIVGLYTKAEAKEKLEMALSAMVMDKYMDPAYNEGEYIDNRLKQEGMKVEGNIVTVDGWQFEIDRSNLSVKQ